MFLRMFLVVGSRNSPTLNFIPTKKICHKAGHVLSQKLKRNFTAYTFKNYQFHAPVINSMCVRYKSEFNSINDNVSADKPLESSASLTVDSEQMENLIVKIPDPPLPVQSEVLENLAEPTFHSLGLGSWYPSGILQQFLEILHVNISVPWWATIVMTTVCVRLLIFPINIRMQKHFAIMQNIQPQIQVLQQQITEARTRGDQLQVCRLVHELKGLIEKGGTSPLYSLVLPLVQAPIFLSFYYGLKGMVHIPVESLKYGGLWWFENLTVPDQYYLLPFLTCATLSLVIESGADSMSPQTMGTMRYILRCAPIAAFFIIINFEGAILCYWLTTNMFSLFQVLFFKIPAVRTYFQIPKLKIHDKNALVRSKKSFSDGIKETWLNVKMAREIDSRQMYEQFIFEKAGKQAAPKVYDSNPLKAKTLKRNNLIISTKKN